MRVFKKLLSCLHVLSCILGITTPKKGKKEKNKKKADAFHGRKFEFFIKCYTK